MRLDTPPRNSMGDIEEDFIDSDGEVIILDDNLERIDTDDEDEDENEGEDDQLLDINSVLPEHDDSILTFKKHNGAVFCCSLHPHKNICATGGEDDKAYVWDTSTGEVIHEITNHKDTVIAATFSYDGNYLATGDMAGELQVFKINNDFKRVWEYSMGDMCWLKWHNATNVLMAGADSGEIYVWRIPSGDCKVLPGNGHKCETADLSHDGKKLFAGYGNGTLRLWDIKNCSIIVEVASSHPMGSHTECVSSVSCDPDKSLYLSGAEDGTIVFSSNSGPVCTLHQQNSSVEAVAFCPDDNLKLAATGTLRGNLTIWDTSLQSIRVLCQDKDYGILQEGITTLKWLPNKILLCGTIPGVIMGFDGLSGELKFLLRGHTAEIYDIYYNSRDNTVITASEDGTSKTFRLNVD